MITFNFAVKLARIVSKLLSVDSFTVHVYL